MVKLNIKVVPGAKRDRIAGTYGDAIKIQVSAPPEQGKANAAVLRVLAEALGLKLNQLEVVAGHTQPRKVVVLTDLRSPRFIPAPH
jgi:uncharacterized protein (TIGR00251 family)